MWSAGAGLQPLAEQRGGVAAAGVDRANRQGHIFLPGICTTPQFPINCVHTIDHINMRIPLDGVRSCNSAVPRIFNGNQVPTREFHALCRKFQEELPQVHPGEGTELNEDDCG
nr:uncharacterized protein LOC127294320 isoform X2 [Lolium perenne]XP_051180078.1 uncharacterized protein LOC127294320 isoform X2 [Lolium perenne]